MLPDKYKEFFKTLGNQKRVEIVLALIDKDMNVTDICKKLDVEQSSVSHNLRRLEKCKFVEVNPNGKERIYSLNKETIRPLFECIKKHSDKFCEKNCINN